MPSGHSCPQKLLLERGQKFPAGQRWQSDMLRAPVVSRKVPFGQGIGWFVAFKQY